MKPSIWTVGVPFVAASLVFACSSSPPSRPPVDTSGGKDPSLSPGAGQPNDAGKVVAEDGAVIVTTTEAGVDSGLCAAGACGGCCDAVGNCQTGTLNAACGVSGVFCQVCTTAQTCSGGYCQ
jgi:hypothetical protein